MTTRAWADAALEALGLGLFMMSACAFGTLFEHPLSPVRHAIPDGNARRALMGLAMGSTAVALIYSPFGRRSGAHYNPSVTLAFTRLGRIGRGHAAAYVAAQFLGGVLGVLLMRAMLGSALADPAVHYVVTRPGMAGLGTAFAAEALISGLLMLAVLTAGTKPRVAPWTGVVAGAIVATWITLEAPISGMSMNPARTFASAAVAGDWTALWLYFTAPPLGMLLAVELHRAIARARGGEPMACAKLMHDDRVRCSFCEERARRAPRASASA